MKIGVGRGVSGGNSWNSKGEEGGERFTEGREKEGDVDLDGGSGGVGEGSSHVMEGGLEGDGNGGPPSPFLISCVFSSFFVGSSSCLVSLAVGTDG